MREISSVGQQVVFTITLAITLLFPAISTYEFVILKAWNSSLQRISATFNPHG